LTGVTDAAGGTVAYAYDAVGNRTAMTDANGHTTAYAYDARNRLLSTTDPLSQTVAYAYDAAGNRTTMTKADGTVITYTYDALNRLVATSYPGGSVSYAYDAVGNRFAMTDTLGLTTYTYDALNRLTQVTDYALRSTQFAYDPAGNRTGLTYPDGQVITYTYDLANRLTSVTDHATRTTQYVYDAANRQTAIAYPNAAAATYSYDDADRLLGIVHVSPVSGTLASVTYTLDAVGNRLQEIADGTRTTQYAYDALYRLTGVTYPDGEQVSYAYDPMGNRTTMTSTVSGVTLYGHDAADRLLTAGADTFGWDANGRQITRTFGADTATYTFDPLDRLTQVVSGTTTAQFAYNGDGARLGKTVNGVATAYVQDVQGALPVVLAETTAGQTSLYVYGNDLLERADPAGVPAFYHADGLGSVRGLSDLAGALTDAYTYDAFGAPRSHAGGAGQAFTFAGEQGDGEVGLVFLRARYYDPAMGRFITIDPTWDGRTARNQRYTYGLNNPVIYTDPSGEAVVVGKLSAAGYYGLGAKGSVALYLDPETGQGCVMVTVGGGGGIGAGGGGEVMVSPTGNVPTKGGWGMEAQLSGEALGGGLGARGGMGAQGGFDVTAGPGVVGISGSGDPRVGLKAGVSLYAAGNVTYSWITDRWSNFSELEARLGRLSPVTRDLLNKIRESGALDSGAKKDSRTGEDAWRGPSVTFGDLLPKQLDTGKPPSKGK
ncbi:MAG: RHS repeat protein, partial [Chloroflexi bacterium]|nr:RHS repeat protein [Chloroflexota bacterium]